MKPLIHLLHAAGLYSTTTVKNRSQLMKKPMPNRHKCHHHEEEKGQSSLDMILGLHLFFQGSSIVEEEKQQKELEERARLEAQERSKQAVKAWLERTGP